MSQQTPDGLDPRWIPDDEYARIRTLVPIVCVDLLPLSPEENRVGLILRDTYGGGRGWCMVGGAVMINESLEEALDRHVRSSLGDDVQFEPTKARHHRAFQYFSQRRPGELFDPRKHAVALAFSGVVSGPVKPRGEALDFKWFPKGRLPAGWQFGFEQNRPVFEILRELGQD